MQNQNNKYIYLITLIVEVILAILGMYLIFDAGATYFPLDWFANISSDLVCLLLVISLIIGFIFGSNAESTRYKLLLRVCNLLFISLFFNLVSWLLEGNVNLIVLTNLDLLALFFSNTLLLGQYFSFVVELAVKDLKKKRTYILITYISTLLLLVTYLFNVKYGFIYYVDVNGFLVKSTLYMITYLYSMIVTILGIIILLTNKIEHRLLIMIFMFVPFASTAAEVLLNSETTIYYVCILISIVMAYSLFFAELEEDQDTIISTAGKFLDNDIVELFINDKNKLIKGRQYRATTFVSDLRGFTAQSANMDPQDVVTMLNHYYDELSKIVTEYDGIVLEFLGDGIKCIFGAPKLVDDHAEKAIAAALKIQETIPEINKWNKEHGYPSVKTGIGINTGTIVLASIGDKLRARYTAIGKAVDLTFIVESCSVGGQVLISGSTYSAIKTKATVEELYELSFESNETSKMKIYEISRLEGNYNVGKKKTKKKLKNIEPINTTYSIVNGKHVDDKNHKAKIVELSEVSCAIKTSSQLSVLDNIIISLPKLGKIYAKVCKQRNDEYILYFTSQLNNFEKWVKKTIKDA